MPKEEVWTKYGAAPAERQAFQFYRDLPPDALHHEILQVTDDRVFLSRDPKSGRSYIHTDQGSEQFPDGPHVLGYSGAGLLLLSDKKTEARSVFSIGTKRVVELSASPVFIQQPFGLSESGLIYGSVAWRRDGLHCSSARVWERNGSEILIDASTDSQVTCAEPFGTAWFAGYREGQATLWARGAAVALSSDAPATVQWVNGTGLCGGFVLRGETGLVATVWLPDGTQLYSQPGAMSSRVVRVLEDSSYLIELTDALGNHSYLLGRGGQTVPLTSEGFKSLEAFPLLSIDAVSPNGVMVVTVKEPITGNVARSLVGPESQRTSG